MHQRSISELQGVSTQQGASTKRTTQDQVSWSSKLRRGSGHRCLCPPKVAPLWVWLLLGAMVVPGAWSFLTEEQEELLVELHNYYRGQVSPSASAMLPLKWDPSLKLIAEGYSTKCIWNHNPELEDTGENLFAGTGPLDLREALEKWYMERQDYDFQNNSCDEDKMCGHYTQMVWAGTHRVGCAFHLCNSMEGLDWERVSFLVCNYYPAGNYEDERPYVEGDSCSRCPENFQKCENNLCVAEDDEAEDEDPTIDPNVHSSIATTFTRGPLHPEVPSTTLGEEEKGEEKMEEEKEAVIPPPATTDPYVQPATTSTRDSEDSPPPATTAPATPPPEVPSTALGEEKEDEEVVEKKEEEKRKETTDKMEEKAEREVVEKIYPNISVSAGSVSLPSLLLACLTGILTLRL